MYQPLPGINPDGTIRPVSEDDRKWNTYPLVFPADLNRNRKNYRILKINRNQWDQVKEPGLFADERIAAFFQPSPAVITVDDKPLENTAAFSRSICLFAEAEEVHALVVGLGYKETRIVEDPYENPGTSISWHGDPRRIWLITPTSESAEGAEPQLGAAQIRYWFAEWPSEEALVQLESTLKAAGFKK